MIDKKIIWVFLVTLFIFISISGRFCLAADYSASSKELYEYGIERYKKGDIPDAIHELKKALMVNPNNVKAKDYLLKIYSEIYPSPLDQPGAADCENRLSRVEEQFKSLNDKYAAKEKELQQLTLELQTQKKLLSKKEGEPLAAQKARKEELESLKSQLSQLRGGASSYNKKPQPLKSEQTSGVKKKRTFFQWLTGKTEEESFASECKPADASGTQTKCESCEKTRD